jgi:3-hydroxyethyl bacteriochlorophyllide a dehydrogenase
MNSQINKNHQEGTVVLLNQPGDLCLKDIKLDDLESGDVAVEVNYSGISTGTERLLYEGKVPDFPGMGYPLVPGYESVGKVSFVNDNCSLKVGDKVFVPGAKCFGDIKGLFGGAASNLIVSSSRVCKIPEDSSKNATMLALAATANHIFTSNKDSAPDLIVGHGALGRLIARIARIKGLSPIVVETNKNRRQGSFDYEVLSPDEILDNSFSCIVDASGDSTYLNSLVKKLKFNGEIILAGFYKNSISIDFVPLFLRETKFRVSAQWSPEDLNIVKKWFSDGVLSLDGLITHLLSASEADKAYEAAFNDSSCLKMVLDWKGFH